MDIYIGKFVNTHGIKGEIRILSDVAYKKEIFQKGNKLYIGKNKTPFIIQNYRVHKNYDMITFENVTDINEMLPFKGENIYIKKEEIKVDGYFDEEMINLDVYTDHLIGKVVEIRKGYQDLLVVKGKKEYLIPNLPVFIQKIDIENKKIYIHNIEGLIDEN